MTLRTSILLLLLALLPAAAGAQHLFFKIGGGLASQYTDSRSVGAFKIGAGYEHEFGQRLTLSPALYFYGKGWKSPDQTVFIFDDEGNQLFDEATGQPLTGIKGRSATANYLTLPVLLNYYLRTGESRYVVFSAGPYVALGLAGKTQTKGDAERPGSQKLYYESQTFSQPGARRFDAGLQASVGYQFAGGITVALEADFGLTKFSPAGGRNISGLATLSYTFGRE